MPEGPYVKVGTIIGLVALVVSYLTLADTTRWPPFSATGWKKSSGLSSDNGYVAGHSRPWCGSRRWGSGICAQSARWYS
jgi:hypothetical protein